MQQIGLQYSKDDTTDPTGFLRRARLLQSKFRAEILDLHFDIYGNYLTKEDGDAGKNFYEGFEVFKSVKAYRKNYNKQLYSNMLRSEHIPFNFFVPLNVDKTFCKDILNEFLNNVIHSIDRIEIEFAPKPRENYLNDATSFDTYMEYSHVDGSKGIIGIEVKYTEKEYRLKTNSKQEKEINDKSSRYYSVAERCKLYKAEDLAILATDKFRQIWRNHLLGESILLVDGGKFKHFTSLTLFPQDNKHFIDTSKEYIGLLNDNSSKFLPLTYEAFFHACEKYCPTEHFRDWVAYLRRRYLVQG